MNTCLKYLRHITIGLATAFITVSACSCGNDDPDTPGMPEGEISLSVSSFDFSDEGGDATLTITTPGEWDAVTSDTWIHLSKEGQLTKSGVIEISVDANSGRQERAGMITVLSGRDSKKVEIRQQGRQPKPTDPTISAPDGYELVWNDEFDGTQLNLSDWTHEVQSAGWVNNELQNYVSSAIDGKPVTEVSDGTLKINCFKASNGKIYSGRIYAKVNTGWKYGIFEASIRLPKGRGTWPAYWMMPVNNDWNSTPWPKCGEIDIMEEVGYHANYTSSSIHCESYNHTIGTQKTAERLTSGAQDEFHIYRLEWTEDYIRTYVDGNLLLNFPNDGKKNISTWPFNRAFYPILNLAWGGSWGGAQGVDESCLPATMEVDYIRVFQKTE